MAFFRFRRSIRLLPGLRLNIGKRSASLSMGVRGAHVTLGKTGVRTTVGIPGTGLSYTEVLPHHHAESAPVAAENFTPGASAPAGSSSRSGLWTLVLFIIAIAIVIANMH